MRKHGIATCFITKGCRIVLAAGFLVGCGVPSNVESDVKDLRGCTPWSVGTLSGYNNRSPDDAHPGSVMEFSELKPEFYDHVAMAAVDRSDWDEARYHWADIKYGGQVRRVGVWDACLNEDCPDGTDCCTDNKEKYAHPGYLLDVEATTARRLFGIQHAEDTLLDRMEYRICESFDPDEIAERYGAYRE